MTTALQNPVALCSRLWLSDRQLEFLQAKIGYIEYEQVISYADFHHTTVLVVENLSKLPEKPAFFEQLQIAKRYHIRLNMVRTAVTRKVVKQLTTAGFSPILLKGAALSFSLYKCPERRSARDIDILLPTGQSRDAVRLLVGAGYHPLGDLRDILASKKNWEMFQSFSKDVQLFCPITRVLIEVHWRLTEDDGLRLSEEELFRNAEPLGLDGVPALKLGSEHDLIFLCYHAARHRWKRLHWLVDIDAITQTPLDWDLVKHISEQTQTSDIVSANASLLQYAFNTQLPTGWLQRAQKFGNHPEVLNAAAHLASFDLQDFDKKTFWPVLRKQNLIWKLRGRACWYRVMASTVELARPNSEDFFYIRLPRTLWFAYPAVRATRLVAKFFEFIKRRTLRFD